MKKHISKILALVLTVCMVCCMSLTAFAAEVTQNGGNGTTPVNLTTTNDGTGGGAVTPTAMRVTVPTALPMAMSDAGVVTTATDAKIINNSYGAVRVKSVSISAASGWKLTAFGDKSTLAAEKVDSNKIGFSISIGGGVPAKTDASSATTQTLIKAPIAGCYMTGVGDPGKNTAAVSYAAIVTPLSNAVANATVASVVFVIEWDSIA